MDAARTNDGKPGMRPGPHTWLNKPCWLGHINHTLTVTFAFASCLGFSTITPPTSLLLHAIDLFQHKQILIKIMAVVLMATVPCCIFSSLPNTFSSPCLSGSLNLNHLPPVFLTQVALPPCSCPRYCCHHICKTAKPPPNLCALSGTFARRNSAGCKSQKPLHNPKAHSRKGLHGTSCRVRVTWRWPPHH